MGRHYYPLDFLHVAGGDEYIEKVLGLGPIAYWPLNELSGTTARCWVNPAQNGTYSSDVATWPVGAGIGDGNSAPFFDGTNDAINILTAAFNTAFNGAAGTVMIWEKVANLGVWTDATVRVGTHVRINWSNWIQIQKHSNANAMLWTYAANAVTRQVQTFGNVDITWMCQALTWSAADDAMIAYKNGAAVGTQNALGAWAVGALTVAAIGDVGAAPRFHGNLAHCAYWNRALSPSTIAALAVV